MSQPANTLRPMARLYLFLLRTSGWISLAFVPLFAFAYASGYARDPDMLLLMLAFMTPGVLAGLFLAGTPDRPTFLLRPTRFLKAFFICGFFLSLVHMPIFLQIVMMVVSLDTPRLLSDLGLSALTNWSIGVVEYLNTLDPTVKLEAADFASGAVAVLFLMPITIAAQINAFVVWFARFPAVAKSETELAYEETLARVQAEERDKEKAEAFEAMKGRLRRARTV